MAGSSSFTLKNYDSQTKAKSTATGIVILYLQARCTLMFLCVSVFFSVFLLCRTISGVQHNACNALWMQRSALPYAQRAPFLSSLLRFKNQMCMLIYKMFVTAYAHNGMHGFFVFVHVSAHHFHPFYGFKINQKIRLELFCCIVFSTHYLLCCRAVVAMIFFL